MVYSPCSRFLVKGEYTMRYYNDTITLYKEFSIRNKHQVTLNTTGWKHFSHKDKSEEHFFIHHKDITCRYYPDRYGKTQFWITFSIPKIINGSNLFPVDLASSDLLFDKINNILTEIVTFSTPTDIATWEVSRTDLFLLHPIPPEQRESYLSAYSRLSLGSYVPYNHENTFYLNSILKKHKAAGTVVRIYPKLQEIQDRETTPKAVEDDFERYMILQDELVDLIRIEFQFRRRTLRYFFKNSKTVIFTDIMNTDFQKERINRMIQRLNLNLNIINKKDLFQLLPAIFKRKETLQRAESYIKLINKERNVYPKTVKAHFTANQIGYIRKKLKEHNLHSIVSENNDLMPVELL